MQQEEEGSSSKQLNKLIRSTKPLSVEITLFLCLRRMQPLLPAELRMLIFSYLYKVIDNICNYSRYSLSCLMATFACRQRATSLWAIRKASVRKSSMKERKKGFWSSTKHEWKKLLNILILTTVLAIVREPIVREICTKIHPIIASLLILLQI
jgi:hypothetical protein